MRTSKGLLLTCDVSVKEYLCWLDKTGQIASFILKEIDEQHLFVQNRPNLFEELQVFLDAWHDSNSYSAANVTAKAHQANIQALAQLPPAAARRGAQR